MCIRNVQTELDIIQTIRESERFGVGSCSVYDECFTDEELLEEFSHCQTNEEVLELADTIQDVWDERNNIDHVWY